MKRWENAMAEFRARLQSAVEFNGVLFHEAHGNTRE